MTSLKRVERILTVAMTLSFVGVPARAQKQAPPAGDRRKLSHWLHMKRTRWRMG